MCFYKFTNYYKFYFFFWDGLHSGKSNRYSFTLKKVKGIKFFFKKKIKASWKNGQISQLCTKIKNTFISTIEHLMSALSATGVTNISIQTSSRKYRFWMVAQKNM